MIGLLFREQICNYSNFIMNDFKHAGSFLTGNYFWEFRELKKLKTFARLIHKNIRTLHERTVVL